MQHDHLIALARELSLSGLADALDRQRSDPQYSQMPFTERLAAGLIAERERRTSSRLARMVKDAHLPEKAAPEELINSETRGLNPEGMRDLLKCDWIDHAWNILISGETGSGKTWIAACVAMAAIRAGHKARYYKLSDLLYELSLTHGDGTYIRERGKLSRYKLLILDDFGKVTMNEQEKSILFDLIDDRVGTLSTIVVGQRPYNDWHAFIDDPIIADAILDRLSRKRYHIKLRGESMRRSDATFDSL